MSARAVHSEGWTAHHLDEVGIDGQQEEFPAQEGPGVRTLGWLVVVLMLVMAVVPAAVIAADGDVTVVTQEDSVSGCNGVRTTPGSENTLKQLIGGTLEPGGTARFLIQFPGGPGGRRGREEFVITDCVFIDDTAVAEVS